MKIYYILFLLVLSCKSYNNNKIEIHMLKTLPEKGIYQLSKEEISKILNEKDQFLNIDYKKKYDDRFTINLKDQLLLMIDNKLIEEDFVIDFFEKISDKYKLKIINHIFHQGINKKYKKIINHFSNYLNVNKHNFDDNYFLIVNIQLGNDINKNLKIAYKKLLNNYDNENYNKQLLKFIIEFYDLEKSIELLRKIIDNSTTSIISHPNNNVLNILFNRCFNTSKENIVVKIIYKYLMSRKLDNEWLWVFDLIKYFDKIVDINEMIILKTKEKTSNDEYISILNKRKILLPNLKPIEKLGVLRKIKKRINFSKVLINERTFYKFQDFNLSLKNELNEIILFGDGEFGSIHYTSIIYEYFKPISNGDLDNIIFIDRFIDGDYENREIIAIFNSSVAIATKPKFFADWVDENTLFNFINFVVKIKGLNKKFLIKDEVFLYYID